MLRLGAVLVVFSWLWVIVLKFLPVPFTFTMLERSLKALSEGKDGTIYYEWRALHEISPYAQLAVISSEDQNFPKHLGFDWQAIQTVIEENKWRKKQGLPIRGASTISQQVAKNVFLWQGRSYFRKGLEAYFTILIELIWGKKRIIEVYLNIAEMGKHTFGIQAASRRFWAKNAKQLTQAECAILAAVLPNPVVYSAKNPNQYVWIRQQQILYQMQLLGGLNYLQKFNLCIKDKHN
ncbi:MAG: monofunctional biosynthetic peptidoglycan transglycosylase [Microscillaceae bacterium]|nr:monofunctional biosynthetic peptidoglycan transglycosylase [Microscillaceae bacterium]MDW8459899.1 monofunctional biosynthetic peptidoglycan transglycosylase [Cytophagales bacterium]